MEWTCVTEVSTSVSPRLSYINLRIRESLYFDPRIPTKTPALHAARFDIIFLEKEVT